MTPVFRFTLVNDVLGSKVISEPIGWQDCQIVLDRDPVYHELVENFEGEFVFYGSNGTEDGGVDFIKECIHVQGIKTVIGITIEISFNGGRSFDSLFSGRVDISLKERMRGGRINKLKAPIIRGDFWALLKNNSKKNVDLKSAEDIFLNPVDTLDAINITLPSQRIDRLTQYTGHSGDFDTLDECELATTGNITLSGHQTVDGRMTTDGMRVLVRNQSAPETEGVYNASSSSWSRATDANTGVELEGAIVRVLGGATNANKTFKQKATPVTLGTTPLDWQEYNYVDEYLFLEDTATDPLTVFTFDFYFASAVDPTIKEIENSYTVPVVALDSPDDIVEQIEIESEFGELTIDADIDYSYDIQTLASGGGGVVSHSLSPKLFVQLNDDAPIQIDGFDNLFFPPVDYPKSFNLSGSTTLNVLPGDRIKIYTHIQIYIDWTGVGNWINRKFYGGITSQTVDFRFASQTNPTNHEGFFVHDVGGGIADRILGQSGLFYSEYLGSADTLYRSYPSDGEFAFYGNMRGLQLRGYTLEEKPFFISWDKFWNGISKITPLGLRVDTIDGDQKLVVGPLEEFYDSENVSITLDNIDLITDTYDTEKFYKQIRIGYQKWESEDIGGIDDPQTKRTYSAAFDVFGKEIDILSEFIAASLAIEITRRTTRVKSADYKYDEDVFIIALRQDGVWTPTTDEKFSDVTNLNNPSTRYNIELSAARNMLRFLKWLSGCLKEYPSDKFSFSSGEGNFKMESTLSGGSEVIENQDMSADVNAFFFPEIGTFEYPLGWIHYLTIRENKYMAIQASITDTNHDKYLTKKLALKPAKGNLSYEGWKVEP